MVPVTGDDGKIKFVDEDKIVMVAKPSIPEAAAVKDTKSVGVPGYDFDPYDSPAEHAEGFFIGKIIGKITGEADGFCSTYREWHIFVAGISAGFRAPQIGAIPSCPPLWAEEAQYYDAAAMVTNVAKIYGSSAIATLGGVVLWAKMNNIF